MKTGITAHVLDLIEGCPAVGIGVVLGQATSEGGWIELGSAQTDRDGRVGNLLPPGESIEGGIYRLTFKTGAYFLKQSTSRFYPFVQVVFEADAHQSHYHIPLLLSRFGYSTYRGS